VAAVRDRITDEEREAKREERRKIREANVRHQDVADTGSDTAKAKARDVLRENRRKERALTEEIGDEQVR
jgi:parvulin-like peptidyl-prolyl isomerase